MGRWTDYKKESTLNGEDELMSLVSSDKTNKRITLKQVKDFCGQSLVPDTTLSIPGAAAEAAETGNKIRQLQEELEKLKKQISGGGSNSETPIITLSGAGFGIGNSYSNPEGGIKTNYGNINAAFIKAIAEAGFKFVRVIIDVGKNNWSAGADNQQNYPDGYTGGMMDFTISSTWIATLKNLADLCKSNGLQLTICPFGWMIFWAQVQGTASSSGYSGWGAYYWASPNNITKAYCTAFLTRLWTQLATAFKDYSDLVAFELVNEPINAKSDKTNSMYYWRLYTGESSSTGTTWSDDWDGLSQSAGYTVSAEAGAALASMELSAITAIRSTGAKNLILCPTYGQNKIYKWIEYINENVVKKSGDSNCKIAIHWYSPDAICGANVKSGAIFDAAAQDYAGNYDNYTAGILAINEALSNNISLVVTEGSVCMSKARVADSERLKWAAAINENIIKKGIPFSLFDNGCLLNGNDLRAASGEDYGILDRTTLAISDTAMVSKFTS